MLAAVSLQCRSMHLNQYLLRLSQFCMHAKTVTKYGNAFEFYTGFHELIPLMNIICTMLFYCSISLYKSHTHIKTIVLYSKSWTCHLQRDLLLWTYIPCRTSVIKVEVFSHSTFHSKTPRYPCTIYSQIHNMWNLPL